MAESILVVDDDREIVRLLQAYLEKAGYQVSVAYDGETALHVIRHDRPDLVLLDLSLPGRGGLDVTRIVRDDSSLAAMPIVMITARVEDQDKIVGLELGADDYVTKPFNPREVMARVRAVLRRSQEESAPPRVIRSGKLTIDLDQHQVLIEEREVNLTRSEFSLLRTLAESPGHAFTRSELIEHGLGYGYEGSLRTVDSHIKNLRRKLAEAGVAATELVETVFGVGYRLRPQGGHPTGGNP
jgi:two-component system alkaline phosphatase synthesis response regulator PhoP